MKITTRIKYACTSVLVFLMGAFTGFAQNPVSSTELKTKLDGVTKSIGEIANPLINIGLAVIGVIAVGVAIWAYSKKKKGDANANDGLMDAAWTTLAIVAFIYVVKSFFFGL